MIDIVKVHSLSTDFIDDTTSTWLKMHYGPSQNFNGIASRQHFKMIKLAKIHCCLLSQNSNDDTFDLDWKFTMLL